MGQRGKDEHKIRTQMLGDQIQLCFMIPSLPSLKVKQILAFPVLLIFRLGSLLPNWPLRYPFKHTKGAPVFIKTGFRLTMNFEDIWLIMIGSFYDRDICLWGQCGSIEATRNWISTKPRKPQFIWPNWEGDKDISKFPYLLLGLFRSVRKNLVMMSFQPSGRRFSSQDL